MKFVVRALVGVAGLLAVLAALGFWFSPDMFADKFGITPQSAPGYSTLRADFGALFGGGA
jgi:hypothetical protein